MLIRLEQSFIETESQLNKNFAEGQKQMLSSFLEAQYDKIRHDITEQEEKKEEFAPKTIELGSIDSRAFTLNLYYNKQSPDDNDVPTTVKQLLPTISPVRMDIMAALNNTDENPTYLKVGQVYDDGDPNCKYIEEAMQEDEGLLPMDQS
ncbi:MAG: hypothetical protein M3162_02015 [Thermoproteota archaeon]|nr:hypothetical protein [Thermoproteota archaeon]